MRRIVCRGLGGEIGSAVISPCGTYRYGLMCAGEALSPGKPAALFVMLNPRTADARLDDPTIRRRCGFAKVRW
ncbi:DUF1643 domain-containing protein [Paraburkholderia phytofirmans]|uniref:DUF1643 domain-containing protein n=2 Tax=Paraburkholderia phytofirmans TaxID=261302 RepID=B2T5T9_PARPJ|nr:DUF1643 domain-containing protein [Paraburkholderia phytofirmans]ACD17039.1 conserved hypothetical protein [Paraburkholderia phytofirmans PsJN]